RSLELQAIELRSREGPFVRQYDTFVIAGEADAADEALAGEFAAQRREALVIAIEGGLVVAAEDSLALPLRQEARGAGVFLLAFSLGEDEAHEIVRALRRERAPFRRRDDVVRGSDELVERAGPG